ncbi:MAG: hypothetical protein NW237_03075 [Cyanobacteriota bacterium]|nr:hypothetical protein [Cyanobacteriota bacterium]
MSRDIQADGSGQQIGGYGLASLVGLVLLLLVVWNLTDPLPPAWDEAQHLLQGQAFGSHLHRFDGSALWWQQFFHLNQRYPPLTYWLGIPFAWFHPLSRADGQVINLLLLGVLGGATQRIGVKASGNAGVGWLAAGLLLLYPAIGGLAHVYMLELVLLTTITLSFWAALAYWQDPSWRSGVGWGASLGLVLLTKWTGVFFLVWPCLAILARVVMGRRWRELAYLGLGLGVAGLLIWPWYSANWLFVLTNGLGYASTSHYYVQCDRGSLCWWTIYLRWLPQQMSPVLCGLPLLAAWRYPKQGLQMVRSNTKVSWGALLSTLVAGYGFYTLIDIKDIRFTLPLLPLLAVISAIGIQRLWGSRRFPWGRQPPLTSWKTISLLGLGSLSLLWQGQPFTPGVAPLWQALSMQWQEQQPQQQLTTWMQTYVVDPSQQKTLGVLPNTELLSSETLTYLAALADLPLAFRPLGQTPWPEVEMTLLDAHLSSAGDWGVTGPFLDSKRQIWRQLHQHPQWQSRSDVLPSVGSLTLFQPVRPPFSIFPLQEKSPPALVGVEPAPDRLNLQLTWQGNVAALAQTLLWADLTDPEGIPLASGHLGHFRLRPDVDTPVELQEILTLERENALGAGEYSLTLTWQTADSLRQSQIFPWTLTAAVDPSPKSVRDPLDLLEQAALAASEGNLEELSTSLAAWTTLQYHTYLTQPDRVLVRKLLEGSLNRSPSLVQQQRLHYQLGLLAITQLQYAAAQGHFQTLTTLDPQDDWAWAYLALVKLVFTHDIAGIPDLKQQLRLLSQPICQSTVADPGLSSICQKLAAWLE